ncbi:MAG: hypothetical protein JJ934_09395 [Pseudomonadales bacterium]|nr:hypothetical protein [Pseudomonadales bacterium]
MTAPLVCWNCGASLDDIPRPISRHANCSKCFEVLHCCRMCRHYMPDKRPYCDHDRAEPPVEKESANFCDYFKPTNRYSESDASKGDRAKSDLDALFGGETVDELDVDDVIDLPDQDDARNKWNDLFDD